MFRAVCPSRKSLSLWEQQRRPPPEAETGRSCWGRGQQDASDSEANAGCRNPGSVCKADGEGEDAEGEAMAQRCPCTDKGLCLPLCSGPSAAGLPSQAASRPALPKGEPSCAERGYYYYKNERRFCQAKKRRQMDFSWNFCPENAPERKTGLDNGHVMGYKERERSAQGDGLPAKGEAGRPPPCAA